jgi:hypothetical protein
MVCGAGICRFVEGDAGAMANSASSGEAGRAAASGEVSASMPEPPAQESGRSEPSTTPMAAGKPGGSGGDPGPAAGSGGGATPPALPNTGDARAGEPCDVADAQSCPDPLRSPRILRCDGRIWIERSCLDNPAAAAGTVCRMDGGGGVCQYRTEQCTDASVVGARVCLGDEAHVCELNASALREVCTGATPECTNGECACSNRCAGECRSLKGDAQHCGRCDHACRTQACFDGLCMPEPLATLQFGAQSTRVDATHAYFIDYGGSNKPAAIMRMPLSGGPTQILANNLQDPQLAIDASAIYFSELARSTIKSIPLAGGEPTLLVDGVTRCSWLQTDETWLYWVNGVGTETSAVMRVAKSGGMPMTVVSAPNIFQLLLAGDALFYMHWAADGTLARAPKAGGSSETVALLDTLDTMVAHAGHVYFAGIPRGETFLKISRVPVAGGSVAHIVDTRVERNTPSHGLAVDDRGVFYGLDERLLRRNLDGSGAETLLAKHFGSLAYWHIATADAEWLYLEDTVRLLRFPKEP